MSGFTLDTSGAVYMPKPTPNTMMPGRMEWGHLSPFEQGYVEASAQSWPRVKCEAWGCNGRGVFSANNSSMNHCAVCDGTGKVVAAFRHLVPETLDTILKDCAACKAEIRPGSTILTAVDGGWLWASRQAGSLSRFPPLTPILSEDGKVRFSSLDAEPSAAGEGA